MAQSLAFWFQRHDDDTPPELPDVELHFNYWSLPKAKVDYLDIGVKLSSFNTNEFKSLNFYLPFRMEDVEYHYELGEVVCNEDVLIPAIFNAELISKEVYQTGQYELTISGSQKPLRVITQIQEDQEGSYQGVKISNLYQEEHSGIQLSFPSELFKLSSRKASPQTEESNDTKPSSGGPDRYIRFRVVIKNKKDNPISQKSHRQDAFINGNFDRGEIVDFRVNESRNLPGTIRTQLNQNSNIKTVHFFLIRDSRTDFKISHTHYKRCRILENGLWNSYLALSNQKGLQRGVGWLKRLTNMFKPSYCKPVKISPNDTMLIYHWAEKGNKNDAHRGCESLDHFSAFAKFSGYSTRLYLWIIFFLIVVLVGAIGSYLSNLIPSPSEIASLLSKPDTQEESVGVTSSDVMGSILDSEYTLYCKKTVCGQEQQVDPPWSKSKKQG